MIPKSKYIEFFTTQRKVLTEQMELIGDVILVEKVKFPEARTAAGLYIPEAKNQMGTLSADKPSFFRVLLPGQGYYDDTTGESVSLNAAQGDIILVGAVSVKLFSQLPLLEAYEPDTLGLTREADIQMRFRGEDAFTQFMSSLNAATQPQS